MDLRPAGVITGWVSSGWHGGVTIVVLPAPSGWRGRRFLGSMLPPAAITPAPCAPTAPSRAGAITTSARLATAPQAAIGCSPWRCLGSPALWPRRRRRPHLCPSVTGRGLTAGVHNGSGQLGTGRRRTALSPVMIAELTNVAAITAGGGHRRFAHVRAAGGQHAALLGRQREWATRRRHHASD